MRAGRTCTVRSWILQLDNIVAAMLTALANPPCKNIAMKCQYSVILLQQSAHTRRRRRQSRHQAAMQSTARMSTELHTFMRPPRRTEERRQQQLGWQPRSRGRQQTQMPQWRLSWWVPPLLRIIGSEYVIA